MCERCACANSDTTKVRCSLSLSWRPMSFFAFDTHIINGVQTCAAYAGTTTTVCCLWWYGWARVFVFHTVPQRVLIYPCSAVALPCWYIHSNRIGAVAYKHTYIIYHRVWVHYLLVYVYICVCERGQVFGTPLCAVLQTIVAEYFNAFVRDTTYMYYMAPAYIKWNVSEPLVLLLLLLPPSLPTNTAWRVHTNLAQGECGMRACDMRALLIILYTLFHYSHRSCAETVWRLFDAPAGWSGSGTGLRGWRASGWV